MRKLTDKQIKQAREDFDSWLDTYMIKLHDEVYKDEQHRSPCSDDELIDEYHNARNALMELFLDKISNWGIPEKKSLENCHLSSEGYPVNNKLLREDAKKVIERPKTKEAVRKLTPYLNNK